MPHAIIETIKDLSDISCVDLFICNNRAIVPIESTDNFFIDVYKKNLDTLIVKLNKITRPVVTDNIKKIVFDIASKIANQLNAKIKLNNLSMTNTNDIKCECNLTLRPLQNLILSKHRVANLEIGFGKGEFLIKNATQKPNELFYGIEILGKSFYTALKRCCELNLKNIFLVNYDARFAIDAFEDNQFDNVYLNFPEPWFKSWRIKHSILNIETFGKIVKKMNLGGILHIITDNYPFAVSASIFAKHFNLVSQHKHWINIVNFDNTLYAKKWIRYNRSFYNLELIKKIPLISQKCYLNFPIVLKKHIHRNQDYIFKTIGIYKNHKHNYSYIEVSLGSYLTQHVFFKLYNNSLSLASQTNFILNQELVKAIKLVS